MRPKYSVNPSYETLRRLHNRRNLAPSEVDMTAPVCSETQGGLL
jgi:hypothetical protein